MTISVTSHGSYAGHDAWQRLPRRFIRMIPECHDTSRAFIGYTCWHDGMRLMFTWRWRGEWHRLYNRFGLWPLRRWDVLRHEHWPVAPEGD